MPPKPTAGERLAPRTVRYCDVHAYVVFVMMALVFCEKALHATCESW